MWVIIPALDERHAAGCCGVAHPADWEVVIALSRRIRIDSKDRARRWQWGQIRIKLKEDVIQVESGPSGICTFVGGPAKSSNDMTQVLTIGWLGACQYEVDCILLPLVGKLDKTS